MRKIFILLLLVALGGCASAKSQIAFERKNRQESFLNGLSKSEMFEIFDEVYDKKVDSRIDEIAKDITVMAFMNALQANAPGGKKGYVSLRRDYKKVELKKWSNIDLETVSLEIQKQMRDEKIKKEEKSRKGGGSRYWGRSSFEEDGQKLEERSPLQKERDSMDVIRYTALYSVDREISRRQDIADTWSAVGGAAGSSLDLAVRVASMLAMFMI